MSPCETILIIDDEASIRDEGREILQRQGMQVHAAATGVGGLQLLAARHFDLGLLDLEMPEIPRMEIPRRIRREFNQTAVVVITGYPSIEAAVEAIK